MIIGILAAIIPYFAIAKLKSWLGYDDALDTFGVHWRRRHARVRS
jgi:Amt family ammonium transporter